jgi:DNA-binding Lrp family transcriptional regulator
VPVEMTASTLPNSSKEVLEVLDSGCEMTYKDLVIKTNMNPRTVRYAIKKLKERDVLVEKLKMTDLRQVVYKIRCSGSSDPNPRYTGMKLDPVRRPEP